MDLHPSYCGTFRTLLESPAVIGGLVEVAAGYGGPMSKPPPAFWQDPEGDGQDVAPLPEAPDEGAPEGPADDGEDRPSATR